MSEKKLVKIIIIQAIIIIVLVSINVFLIVDLNQDNDNNKDKYNLISNEVTDNISIGINWSRTESYFYKRCALPFFSIKNNNKDTIIASNMIQIELRSKDLSGNEFDDSTRFVDDTLYPNDRWIDTISVDIPGNITYNPGYSIEVYIFYNGQLFYTTSKTFPAIK